MVYESNRGTPLSSGPLSPSSGSPTRDYTWLVALSVLLMTLPMFVFLVTSSPDIRNNEFLAGIVGSALILSALSAGLYLVIAMRGRIAGGRATRVFLLLVLAGMIGFPLGAVLHNVLSAVLGVEEGVFFVIAVMVAPPLLVLGVIGAFFMAVTGAFPPLQSR